MANIIVPPGWRLPESLATPESVYWNRRRFIKGIGLGVAAVGLGACSQSSEGASSEGEEGVAVERPDHPLATIPDTPTRDLYPADASDRFTLDRPLTDRIVAATHNNFYEFTTDKDAVWEHTGPFQARPWTVEITGEVDRGGVFDVADLERQIGLEERLYRFRCVEAWAMAVPWTGFAFHELVRRVEPRSTARYVRFITFDRPDEAVGQREQDWYEWPYYEGLRMDEAMNELAFVATGIYGEPLPKQHGAPIRLVLPWKYGFKSPKSVVRIEFLQERPRTFWSDLRPDEYGFYSNVNPDVPHPRWSQSTEEMIGEDLERETLVHNGYGEWVADLYDAEVMRGIT